MWDRLEYNLIRQIFKKNISGFAVGLKVVIVSLLGLSCKLRSMKFIQQQHQISCKITYNSYPILLIILCLTLVTEFSMHWGAFYCNTFPHNACGSVSNVFESELFFKSTIAYIWSYANHAIKQMESKALLLEDLDKEWLCSFKNLLPLSDTCLYL